MSFHLPEAKLRSYVNPETGNVFGVVSHVCNRVNSLIMPTGFYDRKRASNVVGIFYERYIAYILGGSKTFNPNAQCPDVQLPHGDSLEQSFLFEVKAGNRTNGIVLKKKQLDVFSRLNNCLYAVVFHKVPDIQKRWEESRNAKKNIRQELADPSSIFIVPPQLMLDFYQKNLVYPIGQLSQLVLKDLAKQWIQPSEEVLHKALSLCSIFHVRKDLSHKLIVRLASTPSN